MSKIYTPKQSDSDAILNTMRPGGYPIPIGTPLIMSKKSF